MAFDAQYLVRRVRELSQQFGSSLQTRDGFSSDTSFDASSTPILPALNEYIYKIAGTGFFKAYFAVTTVLAQPQYVINSDCLEVLSVYHDGISLVPTTRDAMDAEFPDWQKNLAGTPTKFIAEGNVITLIPTPDTPAVAKVTRAWGKSVPALLISPADTISGMRSAQAIRVPYGAALTVATIDDTNAAHVVRREMYKGESDLLYQELAAIQQATDDATSLSMDSYVRPTVTDRKADNSK